MLTPLLHFLRGCRPGKYLGTGYGIYDEKKNRPPLVTRHEYDFYECAVCGKAVLRIPGHLKSGVGDEAGERTI